MASPEFERINKIIWDRRVDAPLNVPGMRKMLEKTAGPLPEGASLAEVDAGGVPAAWVSGPDAAPDAAVLYLHGGGYAAGSINTHKNLTGALAKAMGCRVLALDYRLAPENPHPAPVDDALAGYRYLLGQGIPPERVAISGDSAGGGLTMAALLAIKQAGEPLPAAAAPISPWVDMTGSGESMETRAAVDPMVSQKGLLEMAECFLGKDGDRTDPLASPLEGDLSGLPPLLIHVGDCEVLLSDSERLAEKAKAAGVDVTLEVWPEMTHVWHALAGLVPEADQAIVRIAEFLRPKLNLA
ncbi:MAG: alpha/beta hydrolase [Acidimicrobiales bacterium]